MSRTIHVSKVQALALLRNATVQVGLGDDHLLAWRQRTLTDLGTIFGDDHQSVRDFRKIKFFAVTSNTLTPAEKGERNRNVRHLGFMQAYALLGSLSRAVHLIPEPQPPAPMQTPSAVKPLTRKVFIVHGHDAGLMHMVARFVEALGLTATILREQPDGGRTIIEKFEQETEGIDYAVVLATADDVGATLAEANDLQGRARQNVIFELGYFVGAIKRKRVMLIRDGVELPSDFQGVVYATRENWSRKLLTELQSLEYGFTVEQTRKATSIG